MRLAAERHLSPQDLLRRVQTPAIPPPPAPRRCCQCGAADVLEVIQGEYDERGEALREHSVTIELRYARRIEDLTRGLQAAGWRWKDGKTHQGKLALERLICRPCMRRCAVMEREWQGKVRAELRHAVNDFTYYQMVCEEIL